MLTAIVIKIYSFFEIRKPLLYTLLAVVTLISVLGCLKLQFGEDISDFLPTGGGYSKVQKFVSTASGNSRIMIFFNQKDTIFDTDKISKCMDDFVATVKSNDKNNYFSELVSKYDDSNISELSKFMQKNIPTFLNFVDYLHADSLLTQNHAESALELDKKLLLSPAPAFVKTTIKNDPLGLFVHKLNDLKNFRPSECYSLINGHIFETEKKRGIVFLDSPVGMSESNVNAEIVSILEEQISNFVIKNPYFDIKLFGAPVIAVGNSRQIKFDTILTTSLSIVLILVILWFSIRSFNNLFLMLATLMFGFAVSGAMSWLVLGKVSLIALGISAVFTGIAINYPLHFITHLYHAKDIKDNIEQIVTPLVVGNVTTVLAFFSLMFAGSNALRDLGFMGGILLIASIFFTLIFLPHFVKKIPEKNRQCQKSFFNFEIFQKKIVVIPVLILTPILIYFGCKTEFDSDLHNINFMTEEISQEAKHTFGLLNSDSTISVFVTATGNNFENALVNYEKSMKVINYHENLICKVSGVGEFLPSSTRQRQKIELWNWYMESRRDSISKIFNNACNKFSIKQELFEPFTEILNKDFQPIDIQEFQHLINSALKNYIHKTENGIAIVTILKVKPENCEQVVESLSNISDEITVYDEKIVGNSLTNILNDNFNFVLFTAGIIVFVFLWISFKRLELSIISFVPLTVSWFWILGIMYFFSVKFNIVNIILATFIFGQGDDYAVFITEGLLYEYKTGKKVLKSFSKSVLISSLIMFVGIGSLILSQHPAMKSLGIVVVIGMFSVVAASFIFPPLLFRFLHYRPDNSKRPEPYSLRGVFYTASYFLLFMAACFLLYFRSLFMKDNIESKKKFHSFMQRVARMTYFIPGIPFSVEGNNPQKFEKPAIIIANHSSFFDVICSMTLHSNLLYVTNERQQNNFLYGRFMQKADFYSINDGYDGLAKKLKPLVDNGFSVVIFPEGTRSPDGKILRFHQGAFYLSQVLNLDILPVVIHGAGYAFAKNDLIFRRGKIEIEVCERFSCNSELFGNTPLETARNFRHWFIEKVENKLLKNS